MDMDYERIKACSINVKNIQKGGILNAYKGTYEEVVNQGKREVEKGFMPQIKPLSVNLSDYDVIAIGTPTWWYTMAPAVLTFLTTNDFSEKTVIPFMTNGG